MAKTMLGFAKVFDEIVSDHIGVIDLADFGMSDEGIAGTVWRQVQFGAGDFVKVSVSHC
jgi:hypothetical protein